MIYEAPAGIFDPFNVDREHISVPLLHPVATLAVTAFDSANPQVIYLIHTFLEGSVFSQSL